MGKPVPDTSRMTIKYFFYSDHTYYHTCLVNGENSTSKSIGRWKLDISSRKAFLFLRNKKCIPDGNIKCQLPEEPSERLEITIQQNCLRIIGEAEHDSKGRPLPRAVMYYVRIN